MGLAIYDLLGGESVLGPAPQSDLDWVAATRAGLPMQAANEFAKHFASTGAQPLFVPDSSKSRLSPTESDMLVRAANVVSRAIEVLETEERAAHWLHSSNVALGGEVPASLLDTSAGEHFVLDLLERIEYGVYS